MNEEIALIDMKELNVNISEIAMENDYDEQEAIARHEFLEEMNADDADELAAAAYGY